MPPASKLSTGVVLLLCAVPACSNEPAQPSPSTVDTTATGASSSATATPSDPIGATQPPPSPTTSAPQASSSTTLPPLSTGVSADTTASGNDSVEPGETSSIAASTSVTEDSDTGETSAGTSPAKVVRVLTASSGGPLRAFEFDAGTGALTQIGEQQVGSGPNEDVFIANVPGSTQVFAVTNQSVVVYDFDPVAGTFTEGARGTTGGGGTYVSVSGDLQNVYVAHYSQNALSYLTYKDGALSQPELLAAGQKVHSAQESNGGWLLVPCLGSDYVAQYRRAGETLAPASPATVAIPGGPRHFAFHPDKPIAYVLTELSGELVTLEFSEESGLGDVLDTEVIGSESGGKYWGSDVKVTPDGADVFAVERNAKRVYHFSVDANGTLDAGASVDLGGVVRAFDISPDGKHLFLGNDRGEVRVLGFDAGTDQLTPVPNQIAGLGTVFTTLVREF